MATVILEIEQKGLNRYFRLDQPELRIGRALDNDIILSDNTISPHHLVISLDEHNLPNLINLSQDNPLKVNKKVIDHEFQATSLPVALDIGRLKAKLLSSDMPVEETRQMQCQSFFRCMIQKPVSIVLLFLSWITIETMSDLSGQFSIINWFSVIQTVASTALVVLILTLMLAGIVRMTSQRWEIVSSFALVNLILLVTSLHHAGLIIAGYAFNIAPSILQWGNLFFVFFLPWVLWIYLTRIAHANPRSALLMSFILFALTGFALLPDRIGSFTHSTRFIKKADYNNELLPKDLRLQPTLSIDEFMDQAVQLKAGRIIATP